MSVAKEIFEGWGLGLYGRRKDKLEVLGVGKHFLIKWTLNLLYKIFLPRHMYQLNYYILDSSKVEDISETDKCKIKLDDKESKIKIVQNIIGKLIQNLLIKLSTMRVYTDNIFLLFGHRKLSSSKCHFLQSTLHSRFKTYDANRKQFFLLFFAFFCPNI